MLFIKGEEGDVHFTAAPESGRRTPEHCTVTAHHGVTGHVARSVVISAITYVTLIRLQFGLKLGMLCFFLPLFF